MHNESLIISILCLLIGIVIGFLFKSPAARSVQGILKCGFNEQSNKPVYRVEFDIPLEEIPERRIVSLKVVHTEENLGVNKRLYDLESEGIRRE